MAMGRGFAIVTGTLAVVAFAPSVVWACVARVYDRCAPGFVTYENAPPIIGTTTGGLLLSSISVLVLIAAMRARKLRLASALTLAGTIAYGIVLRTNEAGHFCNDHCVRRELIDLAQILKGRRVSM